MRLPLIVGPLYAPYLAGDKGYAGGSGTDGFYKSVQSLNNPRKEGWSKWDFVFDAEKGFTMLQDDKPTRFDWNRINIAGFSGIVIFGDETKGDKSQSVWVDDVKSELGPPMKIKPVAPRIMPDNDPAAEGAPVKLNDAIGGKHPRLLLTSESLPKLRDFYNSDKAAIYREQLLSMVPTAVVPENRKTENKDTWGADAGYKLSNVALHYLLTKDKDSLERCTAMLKWLMTQPNWTVGGTPDVPFATAMDSLMKMMPGGENNSDTTAAFTMVGAALAWDWLYNDLDLEFREQFRQVLWQHARAMYYGGHLGKNPGGFYWTGVPMYNHRWFRDEGLAFAVLATTEAKPEEQWLLGKVKSELQFMADWLPSDGSNHEGPGYGSSSGVLGLTFLASDGCLGTHFFDQPFFHNLSSFGFDLTAPGRKEAFYFADCWKVMRSFSPFYLKTASVARNADELDGLRQIMKENPKAFGIRDAAWVSLLSDDPTVQGGNYKRLPTTSIYPDLGLAIVRENWEDKAVAAMFKCGPPGGYNLNSYRLTQKNADGSIKGINIAHDHPDANSFVILGDGDYLAETDRYCLTPGKLSSSLNSVLINGFGQTTPNVPEGIAWMQPSKQIMTEMGKITAWKNAGAVVVTEGEAAGSYLAYTDAKTKKSRPALDRFRRTFIWVKGGYILVLDDIRSPQPVEVTWLMQGAKLEPVDATKGLYRLSKNAAQCEFQLLSDAPFEAKIGVSTANEHSQLMNWQQLQASATAQAIRFVSIYNPWHQKDLKLTFTPAGAENATITVAGEGIHDSWEWQAAKGKFEAATLHGARKGDFDVSIDSKSAAPPVPLAGK